MVRTLKAKEDTEETNQTDLMENTFSSPISDIFSNVDDIITYIGDIFEEVIETIIDGKTECGSIIYILNTKSFKFACNCCCPNATYENINVFLDHIKEKKDASVNSSKSVPSNDIVLFCGKILMTDTYDFQFVCKCSKIFSEILEIFLHISDVHIKQKYFIIDKNNITCNNLNNREVSEKNLFELIDDETTDEIKEQENKSPAEINEKTSDNNNNNSKEISLRCEMCPKIFKRKTDYKRHLLVHSGNKPFSCIVCKKLFNQKSNLSRHSKTHSKIHGKRDLNEEALKESQQPEIIKNCKRNNVTNKGNKENFLINNELILQCKICNRKFKMKHLYDRHIKAFTNKSCIKTTKHKCRICYKIFNRKCDYNRHVPVHTGKKAYQCSICARSYTQQSNLKRHTEKLHIYHVLADNRTE